MKRWAFLLISLILAMSVLSAACRRRPQAPIAAPTPVPVTVPAPAATPGKIQPQLRLQKGESYNLRTIADLKISVESEGQREDTTETIGIGYSFKVEEVDANNIASVKITYDSVLFKQVQPEEKIEYDSRNPPAVVHPAAKVFAAVVGLGFSMKISPDGSIKDVQGVDAMLTRMLEKLGVPEGPMRASVEKQMREQFGEQTLKENMEKMMAIYPDKPVGIGDSWTRRVTLSKGFPMTLDNTWTLMARKGGVAIIGVHSVIKTNPEAPVIEAGPLKLSYDLSGEQRGTLELQESTGWTLRGKLTQKISGHMKVKGHPESPEEVLSALISMESITITEPFTDRR